MHIIRDYITTTLFLGYFFLYFTFSLVLTEELFLLYRYTYDPLSDPFRVQGRSVTRRPIVNRENANYIVRATPPPTSFPLLYPFIFPLSQQTILKSCFSVIIYYTIRLFENYA